MDKRIGFAFPRTVLSLLTSVLLSFFFTTATASWQKTGQFIHEAHSAFFFTEMVGFVGIDNEAGIYKTTNGGKTWIKANIPTLTPLSGGGIVSITKFFFEDTLKGWASTEFGTTRLLRTTDGGLNWTLVNVPGQGTSVYKTPAALIVTTRGANSSGVVSIDNGATWTNALYDSTNCTDFVDDFHGVATGYEGSPSLRTIDGGVTWQPISVPFNEESWSIYALKGTSTFYIIPEGDPSAPSLRIGKSPVYRSIDYGQNWQRILDSLPFRCTGHCAGFGNNILYVQVEDFPAINGAFSGIWRSDDAGFTWHSVGGPSHNRDRRFFVTGCRGGIVYAFDKAGGVWKTRDGGDGTIVEPDPAPVFAGLPIKFNGRICSTEQASIRISNFYCEDLVIRSAEFVNPGDSVLIDGALTITNAASLPKIIGEGSTDSITFLWDPVKRFHSDTTVSIQIRIRYYSNALKRELDTVIIIDAHAIGDPPNASILPPALAYGAVSFCNSHDSSFTFTNNGCDTLYILSGSMAPPIFYQLTDANGNPFTYPIRLAPGKSFTYKISLELHSSGNFSSAITFRLLHQGKIKDTTLLVSASTTSAGSYIAPQEIAMGAVSICSLKDSLILLKNLACDTLVITKAFLKSAADFSLLSPSLPESLYPDSSSDLTLRLKPLSLGSLTDTLTIEFTSLDDKIILKIPVRGTGVTGEAVLVTLPPVDTLFDLTLTRCDSPRVFPVTLVNPGCKNITIKEVDIQGAPPENVTAAVLQTLPMPINDNGTVNITVTVTPKTVGTFNGRLRVRYQIEGESDKDTLFAICLVVKYGRRVLTMSPDTIDLGPMRLCDAKDTTILLKNIGCDTVELLSANLKSDIGSFVTNYAPRFPLGPGDTTSVHVSFIPIYAGASMSQYSVSTTTDSTDPLVCVIKANITPTDTIRLHLAPVRTTFYVGDTITIRLTAEDDVLTSYHLRDIAFGLNFNGDLLTIVEARSLVASSQLLSGSSTRTLPAKLESQQYLLTGSPFLTFAKQTPLIEFRFIVRLTDTTTTTFFLNNILLNSSEKDFAKCTLGLISGETSAELTFLCGDSTLRQFMRNGSILLSIKPVIPNPVTELNDWKARIPFVVAGPSLIRCQIMDELGRVVHVQSLKTETGGAFDFIVDAKDLPSGAYSYLIELPEDSHASAVGRFVVSK